MLNITMEIRIFFLVQTLLLKGMHLDSLKICDLFLDIKWKTEFGVNTKKY